MARVEDLGKLLPWLKGLILGAFGLAFWCASITFSLQSQAAEIRAIQDDRARQMADWQSWREGVGADVASVKTDVRWLREKFEREKP